MFFHFNPKTREFEITHDASYWLESFVISQIFTDKRDPESPSTGWWAESLEGFDVGSELHKMKRNKLSDENIELALQSVSNALSYLQDQKAISLFDIFPEVEKGALLFNIRVKPVNQSRMVEFGFQI